MIITELIVPAVLALFGLWCVISKKDMLNPFLIGAEEGFKSGIGLIPTLVLLMTAVTMFSASGAAEYIAEILSPFLSKLGIPAELVPLIIVRPVSGSGGTALLTDLMNKYGADSFPARCASVLCASSDTLFYVMTVYLAAGGVKKSRHTLICAVLVMLLGIFLSCLLVRLFYAE